MIKSIVANIILPVLMGMIGGSIASYLGYNDMLSIQHWIPPSMMIIPYILGRTIEWDWKI